MPHRSRTEEAHLHKALATAAWHDSALHGCFTALSGGLVGNVSLCCTSCCNGTRGMPEQTNAETQSSAALVSCARLCLPDTNGASSYILVDGSAVMPCGCSSARKSAPRAPWAAHRCRPCRVAVPVGLPDSEPAMPQYALVVLTPRVCPNAEHAGGMAVISEVLADAFAEKFRSACSA